MPVKWLRVRVLLTGKCKDYQAELSKVMDYDEFNTGNIGNYAE